MFFTNLLEGNLKVKHIAKNINPKIEVYGAEPKNAEREKPVPYQQMLHV